MALWAASAEAPIRVAEIETNAEGRFVLSAARTPEGATLYLVASGGTPTASAAEGRNPALSLIAVLGAR